MSSRWRHPPKTVSPRPYCRSRRGRNGLGSETNCKVGCYIDVYDEDMLRQLRSLHAKYNKVIRMFNQCTVDIKLLLIKCYCASLYCG